MPCHSSRINTVCCLLKPGRCFRMASRNAGCRCGDWSSSFVVFDFVGLNGGDAVFRKQLGKYALALYQASGESAVIDLFATAARTSWLENGKFRFFSNGNFQGRLCPFPKRGVYGFPSNVGHNAVLNLCRLTGSGKPSQQLRT